MSAWFLAFLLLCALFAAAMVVRGSEGIVIAGQSVSRLTLALAAIVILIAWGLFAAVQLGLISDHAP